MIVNMYHKTYFYDENSASMAYFFNIKTYKSIDFNGKLLNSLLASERKQQLKIMDTIQQTLHSPYLGSSNYTDLDNNRRGIQYHQVRIGCLLRASPA